MKICYCFILFVIIISCSKGTSSGNGGTNQTTPPTLTTSPVTNITHLTAISGGTIIDSGGAAITMRGVCWSLNPNPTISDGRTYDGPGAGNFTSSIFVPMRGTQYFVRAYATNSSGTGYGNEVSFTSAGYRHGQIVAGDIVFVVSSDGNSAILAAPADVKIGDSVSFSYWPVTGSPPWTFPWIGATNIDHGWGDQNTDKIVSHPQCPSDAAGKLARNYVSPVDGHGGYYLPNSSELFTLMLERTVVLWEMLHFIKTVYRDVIGPQMK